MKIRHNRSTDGNVRILPKSSPDEIGYLIESMINRDRGTVFISESVEKKFPRGSKGGLVILSTDVNVVLQHSNRILDKIIKYVKTFRNRFTYNSKVADVAAKNNLFAWTVGKFLDGRYRSKSGAVFSENSISVEVIGISSEDLIRFAEGLCYEFEQEAVLVKDYNNGNIMIVNSDGYVGE